MTLQGTPLQPGIAGGFSFHIIRIAGHSCCGNSGREHGASRSVGEGGIQQIKRLNKPRSEYVWASVRVGELLDGCALATVYYSG